MREVKPDGRGLGGCECLELALGGEEGFFFDSLGAVRTGGGGTERPWRVGV